jgi:hypothetical protein
MSMSGLNTTASNQSYSAEQEAIDDACWEKTLNAPENQCALQDIVQEIRFQAMRGAFGSFDSWDILHPTKTGAAE